MNRLLIVTECECHIWIEDGFERAIRGAGRCKRCGEKPKVRGDATPTAASVCKHEGPCLP